VRRNQLRTENSPVLICFQQTGAKVEKAFMSHAEDEEKLADPVFRQLMAEKICEGIVDYLGLLKE
jgi:N-acetylmuramoyl-L-alanine amidase